MMITYGHLIESHHWDAVHGLCGLCEWAGKLDDDYIQQP